VTLIEKQSACPCHAARSSICSSNWPLTLQLALKSTIFGHSMFNSHAMPIINVRTSTFVGIVVSCLLWQQKIPNTCSENFNNMLSSCQYKFCVFIFLFISLSNSTRVLSWYVNLNSRERLKKFLKNKHGTIHRRLLWN
jgi:hypothetical protein